MENIQLDNGEELKWLELNQQYKYLGFGESLTTNKTTKSALKNENFNRLKVILKSELSSKHTFEAINSYAIPALSYGFPLQSWKQSIEKRERCFNNTTPCIAKVTWLDCISPEKMVVQGLPTSPTTARMQ